MAKRKHHGVTEQLKAAVHRRSDATALFEKGRWRGAMYVAGYVVECLLKAHLMQRFDCDNLDRLEHLLTERNLLSRNQSVYTHQLLNLLQLTGGATRLRSDRAMWAAFRIVNHWMPSWRYTAEPTYTEDAADFLDAVDQVSQWIRHNI